MENKLKTYKEIMKQADELYYKAKALENEAKKYFIENRLWSPMEELKDYIGDSFAHPPFTLFYIDLDEEGNKVEYDYLYGEICEIQEDGHMYYSDYDDGIIEWNEKQNYYVWAHWGTYTNIHILGFRRER